MALFRVGGIWSHFTLKLSGQLALAGKGDVGGDDWELLENDEHWSCWMHGDISLGVAEIDSGSGMGKVLHLYVLKSMLIPCSVIQTDHYLHICHIIFSQVQACICDPK